MMARFLDKKPVSTYLTSFPFSYSSSSSYLGTETKQNTGGTGSFKNKQKQIPIGTQLTAGRWGGNIGFAPDTFCPTER
ncbi:hypothetical protein GQ607_002929 [Colletotrichum asianum]|uniref:Uncharacterized protein n=1 Tax=Colletotrichum asianum TaxID=702518 RepID=A0A8H3ZWC5_9PEZI|nr:hypothetical protein GQ607_002929 [Colletotrichum asianum]